MAKFIGVNTVLFTGYILPVLVIFIVFVLPYVYIFTILHYVTR